MDLRAVVAFAAALLLTLSALVQGILGPEVYRLHVLSEIRNRYAKTLITSRVANHARQAEEVSFDAVLPENAFISRFVILMDNVTYEGQVRSKEKARREYDVAVEEGRGAAHLAVSVRDSNVVHVLVNVEAQKKVTFNLTYEELLQRELGTYSLRININPRQPVADLAVEVRIDEKAPLRFVEVPTLKQSNEIEDYLDNTTDPMAHIERSTRSSATVRWAPTKEEQRQRSEEGISGQLVVRYDVDRDATPSQILVSEDGYFVHFYAPPGLPPLPKHVVFVLDVSGSMRGRKIEQLKTAMHTILDELNAGDVFSLIPFSNEVQVWHPGVPLRFEATSEELLDPTFNSSAIVEATTENIGMAKMSIDTFIAEGTTYMFSALKTALHVLKAAAASGYGHSSPGRSRFAPMLVLLTDGEANGRVRVSDNFVGRITRLNADINAAVFTLAFGTGADYGFLRRLALRNRGVGRRIYEAADAHLQLRNFYRQIASPLLADVSFNYDGQQVDVDSLTKPHFPMLYDGGELVAAGRLTPGSSGHLSCVVRSTNGDAADAAPAPAVAHVTSAERLWAYLTVRQLLEQDAARRSKAARGRAKELALRYSFVTSVTSLVVVKPKATSGVNLSEPNAPEEVSVRLGGWKPERRGSHGYHLLMASPAASRGRLASRPVASRWRLRGRPAFMPLLRDDTFAHMLPADKEVTTERPLTLADITWLGPLHNGTLTTLALSNNGTFVPLQLALNQTEGFQSCSSPLVPQGVCRHLAACVLRDFAQSFDMFMAGWMCIIEGSFLGACCPTTSSAP